MQVTVKQGQTIFDIAVQTAGSVQAAFAAAMLNGLSVTDDLAIGDTLAIPPVADKGMLQHYKDTGTVPATALDANAASRLEGIGYWFVQYDFVVS